MRLNTSQDLADTTSQFWRLRDSVVALLAPIRRAREDAALIRYYASLGAARLCDIGLSEGAVTKAQASRDAAASLASDYARYRCETALS